MNSEAIYVQGVNPEPICAVGKQWAFEPHSFRLGVEPAGMNEVVLSIGDEKIRVHFSDVIRAINAAITEGRKHGFK